MSRKTQRSFLFETMKHFPIRTKRTKGVGGQNPRTIFLNVGRIRIELVKVHELLGSSDHNQIHVNIKGKTGNTYNKWRRNFNKEMRTYLRSTEENILE